MAKRFLVTVERMLHVSGTIEVKAKNDDDAESIVRRMLDDVANPLQTTDPRICWSNPVYEDNTFDLTGDVEEAW